VGIKIQLFKTVLVPQLSSCFPSENVSDATGFVEILRALTISWFAPVRRDRFAGRFSSTFPLSYESRTCPTNGLAQLERALLHCGGATASLPPQGRVIISLVIHGRYARRLNARQRGGGTEGLSSLARCGTLWPERGRERTETGRLLNETRF